MKSCLIRTYYGYGDNVWQRPFIMMACQKYDIVYLETFFPFLFVDLENVKFIKPRVRTKLSACVSSMEKYSHLYCNDDIKNVPKLEFPYYITELKKGYNIVQTFSKTIEVSDAVLNSPMYVPNEKSEKIKSFLSSLNTSKKICLIKQPSIRNDWKCTSRLPKTEYFQYIIDRYKSEFFFISISNKSNESFEKELTGIDYRIENGEFELEDINALAKEVDLILTYNCFLYALGFGNKTKTIIINGGFSDPHDYISVLRSETGFLRIVNPHPLCECLTLNHKCHKDILPDRLDDAVKSLFGYEPIVKKNLLISRIRAVRCEKLLNNPEIAKRFNIFTVDHTPLSNYEDKGFVKSYRFPSVGNVCKPEVDEYKEAEIYRFCTDIIRDNNIDIVINAQPLHPYNKILSEVCMVNGVDVLHYETFFDDKFVLDRIGGQYTIENEIEKYIDDIKIPLFSKPDLPKSSREKQPDILSRDNVYQKYGLSYDKEYVVVFGQLLWDYSLKNTMNPQITDPVEFYTHLFELNPSTTFLFKIHPKISENHGDMQFLKKYKNVKIVNESLDTLFTAFDYFASFSSHCILEGLINHKKFATMGYHYCNNPKLVYQITQNKDFENIIEKLNFFEIDKNKLAKYLYFICNLYTIDSQSYKMVERLTSSSDEYFLKGKSNEKLQ